MGEGHLLPAGLGEGVQRALQLVPQAADERVEDPGDELVALVPEAVPRLPEPQVALRDAEAEVGGVDPLFEDGVAEAGAAVPQFFYSRDDFGVP